MKSRLLALLDALPDLLFEVGLDGRIHDFHSPRNDLLALPKELFMGKLVAEVLPPDAAAACHKAFDEAAAVGRSSGITYKLDLPQGTHWFELSVSRMQASAHEPPRFIALARDITARVQAQEDMRIAAVAFETQQGMLICDAQCRILRVNDAFSRITGYGRADVLGKNPSLLNSGRQGADYFKSMWTSIHKTGAWQGEIWNRRKSGEEYPEWLSIHVVKNEAGAVTHYVGAFSDSTLQKSAEAQIESLAYSDELTGLPNRRHLMAAIQRITREARHDKHLGGLLLLDLDDFMRLNDALGHAQGDEVLRQVARRLKHCVRESDTVARLEGDAFALLLTHLDAAPEVATAQAEQVASKVLSALREPYCVADTLYGATASIGVTLLNGQSQSEIDSLIEQAELALFEAKHTGRDTVRFFDRQMQDLVRQRVAMEAGLRLAVQNRELELFYQPQVAQGQGLVGVEALLRWHHPQHGLVMPDAFIALAEETGLILGVGQWVLRSACEQLVHWAQQPALAGVSMAVNVSALQFHQDDFVQQVQGVLQTTGANPQCLKLELTESLLVANVEATIGKMHALKALGVSFSMDDFGTGYSSLSILKRLPLDQLKIDQSFVRGILYDANDAAIARMIVALSQSMGLSVIAEGVETQAQRQGLMEMGCQTYQGYLFGKPVPVGALDTAALAAV